CGYTNIVEKLLFTTDRMGFTHYLIQHQAAGTFRCSIAKSEKTFEEIWKLLCKWYENAESSTLRNMPYTLCGISKEKDTINGILLPRTMFRYRLTAIADYEGPLFHSRYSAFTKERDCKPAHS